MFYLHLPSVFSKNYCQELINLGHTKGFNPAAVNVNGEDKMRTDIRNNSRIIWDDNELAVQIKKDIENLAGQEFPKVFKDKKYIEIGSHFRMYKYAPNEYFKPHKDGSNKINGLQSLITVLIYLNDTIGGETILMPKGFASKEDWISITPHAGDVLLFQHDCWHEGRPVLEGEKYVLRTDIFYK